MLYTVECSYSDAPSEESWNAFYSGEKLPALISVSGFHTSQRFMALTPGCPVYLAVHTVSDERVLSSDEYRTKGGGSFARWQPHITDWYRNLYACGETMPAVSAEQVLLLSSSPLDSVAALPGVQVLAMQAVGLDRTPARRFACVLPRESVDGVELPPGAFFYRPVTARLQNLRVPSASGEQ